MNNRIYNARNPAQGSRIRTLCCCSAGLLRSPTTAFVLARDFNRNTRAVGLEPSFALIPVEYTLMYWAQEIVVMTEDHVDTILHLLQAEELMRPVFCLNIPDIYEAYDPALMDLINKAWQKREDLAVPF